MKRRRIAIAVLLGVAAGAAALVGAGAFWWTESEQPTVYVVVKGDTLFEIARDHGVTVDEIRAWNGIDGDRIEIDQILEIWSSAAPVTDVSASPDKRRPRIAARSPSDAGSSEVSLKMPDPKDCLLGPELDDLSAEEQMIGSAGLTDAQVRDAMRAFVGNTLVCIEGADATPERPLLMEITAGCDGRVAQIAVLDRGDWTVEMAACVTNILGYTPFPAHDLPSGEAFRYPLTYRPG